MSYIDPVSSMAPATALSSGGPVAHRLVANDYNAYALRANSPIPWNEWEYMDSQVIPAARSRLQLVRLLFEAGLTRVVPDVLGNPMALYQTLADMDQEATVSMAASTQPLEDRPELTIGRQPMPLISHGFRMDIRALAVSRRFGQPLDTTSAEGAGRKCAEKIDSIVMSGAAITDGGGTVYGLTNHPSRNTDSFGTNGNWVQTAKTGANIMEDIESMITLLKADYYYGPYWLLLPSGYQTALATRMFNTTLDRTVLDVLMSVPQVSRIEEVDSLPANTVVMFQPQSDVIQILDGRLDGIPNARGNPNMELGGGQIVTIPWEEQGGLMLRFRVMAAMIPLVRTASGGRSGIVVMT